MCYINTTGTSNRDLPCTDENGGNWKSYYESLRTYQNYDAFITSSADFNNPIYKNFIRISGHNLEDYKDIIQNQKMIPISMGVYQYSHFVKDITTNNIYLNIPQTGFGAFFKLICE